MKRINNTGPKTVLLGTPLIIFAMCECLPFITTSWGRSLRKEVIHLISCGGNPYNFSFYKRSSWSTLLKALAKSKYIASVSWPFNNPSIRWTKWLTIWVRQLRPDLKPFWLPQRILLYSMKTDVKYSSKVDVNINETQWLHFSEQEYQKLEILMNRNSKFGEAR